MKISEVIKMLEKFKEENGDVHVCYTDDPWLMFPDEVIVRKDEGNVLAEINEKYKD